jgi:hypothetical protein
MTSRKNKQHSQNVEIAIFIVVVVLLLQFLLPIASYSKWFQWWREHNTADNKYNCLPLTLMAFYNSNTLMYNIVKLFTLRQNQFDHDWYIYFISGIMEAQAIDIIPGGLCTPRSLCESLMTKNLEAPPGSRTFLQKKLNLKGNDNMLGGTIDNNKNFMLEVSKYPLLYKLPSNMNWKDILIGWGAAGTSNRTKYQTDDKRWTSKLPSRIQDAFPCWMNFLAKWGIPCDAPVVTAYITGKSADDSGNPLFPSLMKPLLGITSSNLSGGGWLGYLREGGDFAGRGLAEANRQLYSIDRDDRPNYIKPKNWQPPCNTASLVQGATGLGMGGAFAGAALGGADTGGVVGGPLGAVIGGIIGGVAGLVLTKESTKCTF